jgi:hypothetical protein
VPGSGESLPDVRERAVGARDALLDRDGSGWADGDGGDGRVGDGGDGRVGDGGDGWVGDGDGSEGGAVDRGRDGAGRDPRRSGGLLLGCLRGLDVLTSFREHSRSDAVDELRVEGDDVEVVRESVAEWTAAADATGREGPDAGTEDRGGSRDGVRRRYSPTG